MARPVSYVKECVSPDCTNWLSKTQARHSVKCPPCVSRKWMGRKIQSQTLWDIRDRIVGTQEYSKRSVRWTLRCSVSGCHKTLTFHSKTTNLYCSRHKRPCQRVPYLQAFEWLQRLCAAGRYRTKKFSLTLEDMQQILLPDRCAYCGGPHGAKSLTLGLGKNCNAAGLDRVDPTRGYEKGNVVACCKRCNLRKHIWRSAADMLKTDNPPADWPADSFEMSEGHKHLVESARQAGKEHMGDMRRRLGHFGKYCPVKSLSVGVDS